MRTIIREWHFDTRRSGTESALRQRWLGKLAVTLTDQKNEIKQQREQNGHCDAVRARDRPAIPGRSLDLSRVVSARRDDRDDEPCDESDDYSD